MEETITHVKHRLLGFVLIVFRSQNLEVVAIPKRKPGAFYEDVEVK